MRVLTEFAVVLALSADKLDGTWNFDGMIQDAQLDFMAGWLVAQADAMPTWKPGDEFEGARRRALSERAAASGARVN